MRSTHRRSNRTVTHYLPATPDSEAHRQCTANLSNMKFSEKRGGIPTRWASLLLAYKRKWAQSQPRKEGGGGVYAASC